MPASNNHHGNLGAAGAEYALEGSTSSHFQAINEDVISSVFSSAGRERAPYVQLVPKKSNPDVTDPATASHPSPELIKDAHGPRAFRVRPDIAFRQAHEVGRSVRTVNYSGGNAFYAARMAARGAAPCPECYPDSPWQQSGGKHDPMVNYRDRTEPGD